MDVSIRPAKKHDITVILGLLYELGRPKPKNDSELKVFTNLVIKQISDSDKKILVAEVRNGNVVGMISVIFLPRLNQVNPEMYIPELIVAEKYQKKGIGTKFINSCILLGLKHNCKKIRLESGNFRLDTHRFYEKLGFESNSKSFTKNLE